MKKTTQVIGIFYGKSKTGKDYRVLYLIDTDILDTDVFEGRKCYTAIAPAGSSYVVGQTVDIFCYKGEAILID